MAPLGAAAITAAKAFLAPTHPILDNYCVLYVVVFPMLRVGGSDPTRASRVLLCRRPRGRRRLM